MARFEEGAASILNEIQVLREKIGTGETDSQAACEELDSLIKRFSERGQQSDSETERLRIIRQLSVSVGYRVNTLLTGTLGNIEMLQAKPYFGEDDKKCLENLFEISQKIREVISKMQSIRRYVTMPYVGGEEVIDLDKASQEHHTTPSQ